MATVSFQLATVQPPLDQGSAQTSVPPAPQANMAQPQVASVQQDAVTLVGRTAEIQSNQDAAGGGSAAAGAYFNAERQSFRAANGSVQNQAVQTTPVRIKDETTLKNAQGSAESPDSLQNQNQPNNSGPAALSTTNTEIASAAAGGAASATGYSNAAASTPQQQLQELDQTLQEIGINPQSIALFNRMAMLLYANDPAALKVLVQALQSVSPQSLLSNTSATPQNSTTQSTVDTASQMLSASQPQSSSTEASPSGEPGYPQIYSNIASASAQTLQDQSVEIGDAITTQGQPTSPSFAQTSGISSYLQHLYITLAALGSQTGSGDASSPITQTGPFGYHGLVGARLRRYVLLFIGAHAKVDIMLYSYHTVTLRNHARILTSRKRGTCAYVGWHSECTLHKVVSNQLTIQKLVEVRGIGLHTAVPSRLRLLPAPPDTGIVFRRTDLDGFVIEAHVRNVARVSYATSLMKQGVLLSTTEHLLAALYSCGIDNIFAEIDALEVPILDGSSKPFIDMLREAGIRKQRKHRRYIRVVKPLEFKDGDRWMGIYPAEEFRVHCFVEYDRYNHPLLPPQEVEIAVDRESFIRELAPARTFGFVRDFPEMRAMGLIRGGSAENAVVLDETSILNGPLRFTDEFGRHKALDLIGDLALVGRPLQAKVVAHKAGHALHTQLVTRLLADRSLWTETTLDPVRIPAAVGSSLPAEASC